MKPSDYLLLAITKIRTRKIRSILTMIAASVLVTVLFVGTFTYNGAKDSVNGAAPSALVDKHIAIEHGFNMNGFTQQEKYIDNIRPFNSTAQHTHTRLNGEFWNVADGRSCAPTEFDEFNDVGSGALSYAGCVSAASRSDQLFDYFVEQGGPVGDFTGQAVPILISNTYALRLTGQAFKDGDTPEEKITKVANAQKEILGDQFDVSYVTYGSESQFDGRFDGPVPPTVDELELVVPEAGIEPSDEEIATIGVKVVGIVPDASIIKSVAGISVIGADDAHIIFPESKLPAEFRDVSDKDAPHNLFRLTEFATLDELDAYIASGCEGNACYDGSSSKLEYSYFTDYGRAIEKTFEEVWSFMRWFVLFWGIGVGISIMSTTAKVIVDSRKEIGVFRAIGARRYQIFGIYATYVTLLTLVSFVLSFFAARLITGAMNGKWADDISVQLALLNGSTQARGHYSFFGISVMHILAILAFVIVVALLGSSIPVMRNLRKDPLRYLRDD